MVEEDPRPNLRVINQRFVGLEAVVHFVSEAMTRTSVAISVSLANARPRLIISAFPFCDGNYLRSADGLL